jgi:hypothetical protein
VNAEGGHALQQADGIGYGDVDVWLLQPVSQAGIEKLDFSNNCFRHLILLLLVKVFILSEIPVAGLAASGPAIDGGRRNLSE